MNFDKKKQHIKNWQKFRRVVEKFEVGIEKNKLRRRRNIVEKSQSESKKFDAIDVQLTDLSLTLTEILHTE